MTETLICPHCHEKAWYAETDASPEATVYTCKTCSNDFTLKQSVALSAVERWPESRTPASRPPIAASPPNKPVRAVETPTTEPGAKVAKGCLIGCGGFFAFMMLLSLLMNGVAAVYTYMFPPTAAEIAAENARVTARIQQEAAEQKRRDTEAARELAAAEVQQQFEEARLQKMVNLYQRKLQEAGIDNTVISHVSARDHTLTITVQNSWHLLHKQIRLQSAQNLWTVWANIRSPSDLDKARLKLVDLNGNNVGGSSWLAGSLVSVID